MVHMWPIYMQLQSRGLFSGGFGIASFTYAMLRILTIAWLCYTNMAQNEPSWNNRSCPKTEVQVDAADLGHNLDRS